MWRHTPGSVSPAKRFWKKENRKKKRTQPQKLTLPPPCASASATRRPTRHTTPNTQAQHSPLWSLELLAAELCKDLRHRLAHNVGQHIQAACGTPSAAHTAVSSTTTWLQGNCTRPLVTTASLLSRPSEHVSAHRGPRQSTSKDIEEQGHASAACKS